MDATDGQRTVINFLYNNPFLYSTAALAEYLNRQTNFSNEWTVDRVRAILVRLENRLIVYRRGYPARWQLSGDARNHIAKKGFNRDAKTA